MKMLHIDSNISLAFLLKLTQNKVKFAKMTIKQGNIKKYLRMTIDYSFPDKLILSLV